MNRVKFHRKPAVRAARRRRTKALAAGTTALLVTASGGFALTQSPITTTGWSVNEIYSSSTQTSVSFDAYANFTFYTNTAPYCPAGTGLPTANNGTFTSQTGSGTIFAFQPFTSNNAIELNTASNAIYGPLGNVSNPKIPTGTIALPKVGSYTKLAFLNADANGGSTITYTLNFAGGTTATGTFAGQDWFGSGGALTTNLGRVYAKYEYLTQYGTEYTTPPNNQYVYYNYSGTTPELYENDITVPQADQSLVLNSISFSMASSGGTQWSLFGVSGASVPAYSYTGTDSSSPATFDTSSMNFAYNGSASAFSNNQVALFDDTASGSHTISVTAGGVTPSYVQFNNSTSSYTVNGPGVIGGAGGLYVTGGGLVTINNSNSYTGQTNISSGTLNLNSGAYLAGKTIVVGNGGSFEVTDNSGTAGTGATALITGTGVISTYQNPIPNGPTGALRGGDEVTSTWAGNINVSGSSYIESGIDGTLILTGSISGTGPVIFSGNTDDNNGATIVLSPPSSTSNTYTGETQFIPDVNVNVNQTLLQLGNDNGISPASGLNFVTGTLPENVYLDLNGHNQTVTYLKGTGLFGYAVENSGTSLSTLTVTSGQSGGSPNNFGVNIQGNVALVMNDPTGAGNQILSGTNSYTGGTTIISGTLTAASGSALGSSQVMLAGGTLALAASATAGSSIVTSSNFSSFTLNQSSGGGGASVANVSGNTLTLTTNGIPSTANSAFDPVKVPVSDTLGFTAKFNYNVSAGYADGIAFVLQNDPRGAGAISSFAGSDLGYGGSNKITNSAAVEFELYPYSTHGTAFGFGGLIPGDSGNPTTAYTPTAPVTIAARQVSSGSYVSYYQPVDVTLVYNGLYKTLTETLVGDTQQTTFTTTFTGIDYSSLVGGPAGGSTTAYLGFTAATGAISSTQIISNFSYATNQLGAPQSIGNAIVATGNAAIQLAVTPGSTATGASVGPLTINAGADLQLTVAAAGGNRGVLFTPTVSIANNSSGQFTGTLDLGTNDLVASGATTLTQIRNMIASGYNNGNWNGFGIISSAAASNHLTALGAIVNDNGNGQPLYGNSGTLASNFDGSFPTDGEILVKYTYYGDTNLDGHVDGTDYSAIDFAFAANEEYLLDTPTGTQLPYTNWANGDFNYDGVIDGSDYTLIDNAFNSQGGPLGSSPAALLASITSEIAESESPTSVPEPATAGVLGGLCILLLGRRRNSGG